MNNKDIENNLSDAINAYRKIPKNLEVSVAIKALTGKAVIPFSRDERDQQLLESVCAAAEKLIHDSQSIPLKTGRVNELGNAIEDPLLAACKAVGLNATWPKNSDGGSGRSGYPDIAIDIDSDHPTYLEAKVIAPGSENSSFRSFYLSPSERPKVCVDARHLLVAFTHNRIKDDTDGNQQYELKNYKIIDLALASGKIKFEYQSSNKAMYTGKPVIAKG